MPTGSAATTLSKTIPSGPASLRRRSVRNARTELVSSFGASSFSSASVKRFGSAPVRKSVIFALAAELDAIVMRRTPRWLRGWRKIHPPRAERVRIIGLMPRQCRHGQSDEIFGSGICIRPHLVALRPAVARMSSSRVMRERMATATLSAISPAPAAPRAGAPPATNKARV